MGLETGTYINDLVVTNPASTDKRRFGDDHFRLVKSVLKNSFPTIDGPLTPSVTEFNYVTGVTSALQTQIDNKVNPVDIGDMAETDVQNTFTQGQATAEVAITFSGTIAPDAMLSNAFRVIATNNFTLNSPTNGIDGQVLTLFVQQDGVGGRLLTFGTSFYGSTSDDLLLSTGPNQLDLLTLILGGGASRWYVVSLKKDINNAL